MHVEMAGAGSISHSLLFAFSVLKRSPGPTNHLFRLEHNDHAGSPRNFLGRRCELLTLICWDIFLHNRVPKLRITLKPNNLSASVGGHIGMCDWIIDNHRDVGITRDVGIFDARFLGAKEERFTIPYKPDGIELRGRATLTGEKVRRT
jgi:hypothetical protein